MSHTSQQLGGKQWERPTHSTSVSRGQCYPPANSKQGSTWADPPAPRARTECCYKWLLSRTGRWHAQPQPRCDEFISPHHSVIVHLSLQIHTAVVPGPKHSLPAEIPYSLQSPVLQQVWALHGKQRTTSPIHQLVLHEVHSHHSKYKPDIFFVVQSSSFLIHRNETNGILFFQSWFSKTESHWIKDGFETCQLFWNQREGI